MRTEAVASKGFLGVIDQGSPPAVPNAEFSQ